MKVVSAKQALIVDIGSICIELMRWRHQGVFASADVLLERFSDDPDRWLRLLGSRLQERVSLELRDFDSRLLLLTRTLADRQFGHSDIDFADFVSSAVDVEESDFGPELMKAVNRFARLGFQSIFSTASSSLQVSIEFMNMIRHGEFPGAVVIVTADPEIAQLLPILRSFGVRTRVVAILGYDETKRIDDLADTTIDLPTLAATLELDLSRGFIVREPSHRQDIYDEIVHILDSILATDAAMTVEDLRLELENRLEPRPELKVVLPRQDGGLRELLRAMQRETNLIDRHEIIGDRIGLVDRDSDDTDDARSEQLREIARYVEERLSNSAYAVALVDLANEISNEFDDVKAPKWLDYHTFRALIEAARRVRSGENWIFETTVSPGYLRLRSQRLPTSRSMARGPVATGMRKYISDFASGTPSDLREMIAIMATILGTSTATKISIERLGITREMVDEGKRAGVTKGRAHYQSLIKNARLGVIDSATPPSRSLIEVSRAISIDPQNQDGTPGGAQRLQHIISEYLVEYLEAEKGLEEDAARELTANTFGIPKEVQLDEIGALYQEFERRAGAPGGSASDLLDLMLAFQTDREDYLKESPTPPEDDEAVRQQMEEAGKQIEEFVLSKLSEDRTHIPLNELFKSYMEAGAAEVMDIAQFVRALGERSSRWTSDRWTIDYRIPPGILSVPGAEDADEGRRSQTGWLGRTLAFTRYAMRERKVVIAWPEASFAIHRHLSQQGGSGGN